MFFGKKKSQSKEKQWPFKETENSATITTTQVLNGHPILRVSHDEDGGWQMLCGTTNNPEDAKVVALKRLYDHDPSLSKIASLPPGAGAYRTSMEEPWVEI